MVAALGLYLNAMRIPQNRVHSFLSLLSLASSVSLLVPVNFNTVPVRLILYLYVTVIFNDLVKVDNH